MVHVVPLHQYCRCSPTEDCTFQRKSLKDCRSGVLVGLAMMQFTPCILSLMFQNSYFSTENDLSEVISFLHWNIFSQARVLHSSFQSRLEMLMIANLFSGIAKRQYSDCFYPTWSTILLGWCCRNKSSDHSMQSKTTASTVPQTETALFKTSFTTVILFQKTNIALSLIKAEQISKWLYEMIHL